MYITVTTKASLFNILPMTQQHSLLSCSLKMLLKIFAISLKWIGLKSLQTVLGSLMQLVYRTFFHFFLIEYRSQLKTWAGGLNTYSLWKIWSQLKLGSGCEFCKGFLISNRKTLKPNMLIIRTLQIMWDKPITSQNLEFTMYYRESNRVSWYWYCWYHD